MVRALLPKKLKCHRFL